MVIIWRKSIREHGYIHVCEGGGGDAGIHLKVRTRLEGFFMTPLDIGILSEERLSRMNGE